MMEKKLLTAILICGALSFGFLVATLAQEMKPIQLPQPKFDQSKSLFQALKERRTTREFASAPLSQQILSNLLWAAFGINRPDSGKRTAPSARNKQEIDIYVASTEGLFLYDPAANALIPIVAQDVRALTGGQSFVKDAPVTLVYVADLEKMDGGEETDRMFLAAADTGFIAQNVYLYCASEGLATVVRAGINRPKLAEAMKLRSSQRITLAQTVGLPKK